MNTSDFLTNFLGTPTLDYCYQMGRDYAKNGANEQNCHFLLFGSEEKTKAWERGRDEAKTNE